jgi:predicted nucleic acid-binding protein
MRQRIYIDTSVVGGFFDEEFKDATQKLFKRLEDNEVRFIISDLLELELIQAPKHVNELLLKYPTDRFERIELTEEILNLADKYIAERVVGRTSLEDCRHIALATVNRVDVLASWNFKHIVNLERIKGYNSVNLKLGYPTIEIRTPQELVSYGD